MCPDLVEVVHRERSRVKTQVGVEPVHARPQSLEPPLVGLVEFPERIGVRLALGRMRLAGAALVDEDDVAVGLNATKELAKATGHLRRALTGSTGEEEQGVGLRVVAQRGQDDDSKVD